LQRSGIGREAAGITQLLDPLPEARIGHSDQRDDSGCDAPVLLEQPVEDTLHTPRELAELGQADHAAAAFQRVELAAHGNQRFAVARVVLEDRPMRVDRVEHLVGFGQVDVEQFGIERRRVGIK
jgi:hypothetical protein